MFDILKWLLGSCNSVINVVINGFVFIGFLFVMV